MADLDGQVVVVTGAASGIGNALARGFAAAGCPVVLADVEAPRLAEAVEQVRHAGVRAIGVATDVSDARQMDRLADEALKNFGRVDIVCNNAGVSAGSGPAWEISLDTWRWVLGVNLGGLINGIRTFVPLLRAQGSGHIVNTASLAGLVTGPGIACYTASKHAVVALSECLYKDLRAEGSAIGVTVACPGFVHTGLLDAERNRPGGRRIAARDAALASTLQTTALAGLQPEEVADRVLAAVRTGTFWVLTHPARSPAIVRRVTDMVDGLDPDPGYPT